MPATYPGYTPWESLDGDYTLSADRETLTIPASPAAPLRSGSIDTGGTLANVQWSGTATGTVLGRTSAAALQGREDTALILPGSAEWRQSYFATLGTKPSAQGWTAFGVTDSAPSGGLYTLTGGYNRYVTTTLSASKLTILRWSWRRNSGHAARQAMYFITPMGTALYYLNGSGYGADAGRVYDNYGARYLTGVSMTEGDLWDFIAVIRSPTAAYAGINVPETATFARARGSYAEDDLIGYAPCGQLGINSGTGNTIYAGDIAAGTTNVSWGTIGVLDLHADCDQYGYETLANPDTSFARNQQHWQLKSGTLANGTLTGLDLQGDLSAPSQVSGLSVAAIGSTGIGGVHTAVAGASAYYHEVLDADNADAVIEADYNYSPGCAFTVTAGNRKVRSRAVTDDGVKSVTATTSASTPVPAVTPTITATTDNASPAAGEDVTVTWTATGGAVMALDGEAAAGSGSQVVATGEAAAGTTPPGAYTIAYAAHPGTYSITYVGGTMRIILGATGDAAKDTITLEKSTNGLSGWATDSTQGTPTISHSALTYNGAVVGTSYATNHGWSMVTGTYYRTKLLDVDGRATYSNALIWGAQSAYEVTVSGVVDEQWYDATEPNYVTAKLLAVVSVGTQQYTTTTYRGEVQSDGSWSITGLPASAVAVVFTFPDRKTARKTLPATAGAVAFGALAAG